MTLDLGLDLFPFAASLLAALTCGLLGNFLVLRRLSLMGDAISHSVLPGLVAAFLLTSSRSPLIMFAGAAAAGLVTVGLVELIKRLGRVEPGAAMGVAFSVLFAAGVLLMEQAAADRVDLDAECVLHGQLETLIWYGAPDSLSGLFSAETVPAIPRQVWTLLIVGLLAAAFVGTCFKELRITAFDPALATSLGIPAGGIHIALMVMTAAATVASFEAVGSILVIAMLICPAATARLLTDRLRTQIWLSLAIAGGTAITGYVGATAIPAWFGRDAVNAAGSMAVAAGVWLVVAMLLAPEHGVVARALRRRNLARTVARDHVLALLHRSAERGQAALARSEMDARLAHRTGTAAIGPLRRDGLVTSEADGFRLTERGRRAARAVVRRHRLWETFLVDEAGLASDHVHDAADRLEHLPIEPPARADVDPHGTRIPPTD